jgi:hypothetical protein
MYKKSSGLAGAGGLAATGAPNVAILLGVMLALCIVGLCFYRTSAVLNRNGR